MDKEIPFLFDTDTVLEIQRQQRELLFQAIENDKVIEKNLDLELFSYLGLTLSNCRNYSNNAKILLLLLSGRIVENNHIHILIGIPHREENMRKERWMVEQNLRKNAEKVAAYAKMYPLSCAEYAAQCIIREK